MPLNPIAFADGLTALFDGRNGYPKTTAEAAQAWAALYRRYAADARAGVTAPLPDPLVAAEAGLVDRLAQAFAAAHGGAVAGLAADLDAAFVAFWSRPPVGFAFPGPPAVAGVVTVAPAGVLGSALAGALAAGVAARRTAAAQAQALVGAIDGWTRTVTVVNTPPGPSAPVFLT
ncbi:hypothetical protein [Streptosporangium sp. NPDC002607]